MDSQSLSLVNISPALFAKILAFALYLGFMIYIGFRNAKKNVNSADFFLGGRKVGPWVTALSAEASDSSAWLLMGLPGLCYLGGIKETFWTSVGLVVGTYLNWLFVAKPLRRCTVAFGDSITIPEFFTNRFKDKTHLISLISVVFIVLFFTIYTASGFVACAKLFHSVFNLPYQSGLIIGLIVILSYTILGGYLAVCTTDFIQGFLIFIAFVVSAFLMVVALGGPAEAISRASEFSAKAVSGEFGDEMRGMFSKNQNFSVLSAISAVAWGLGYFGMPHVIIRFMGIRSVKEIDKARRIGISWMIISYICTFLIGTLGTVYLLPNILQGGAAETVFSETMIKTYPSFIAGLFLCGILAASMSTADSQLLSASSAISRDLFKGILKRDASEKTVLLVGRISVLLIAAVAFCLSLNPESSIFGLVSYAWAGFGATFGALVLLALFWRGATNKGAIAGLLAGGITVVAWHNNSGGIFDIYEILPGFIASLLFTVVVSLLDRRKDEDMLREFDAYRTQSFE